MLRRYRVTRISPPRPPDLSVLPLLIKTSSSRRLAGAKPKFEKTMTSAWVDAVADVTALLHSTRDGVLLTNSYTHAVLRTHSITHMQEIASKLHDSAEHRAWEAARAKRLEQEQIARKIEALEQEAQDAANAFGDYMHRWTHFCEQEAPLPLPAADAAVVASGRYEHDDELLRKLEEWSANVTALDDEVDELVALADDALVSLTDYDAAAAALSTPLPPQPQPQEKEHEQELRDD